VHPCPLGHQSLPRRLITSGDPEARRHPDGDARACLAYGRYGGADIGCCKRLDPVGVARVNVHCFRSGHYGGLS
jgi:hypothetical protein